MYRDAGMVIPAYESAAKVRLIRADSPYKPVFPIHLAL
jgi:hypothetical protein